MFCVLGDRVRQRWPQWQRPHTATSAQGQRARHEPTTQVLTLARATSYTPHDIDTPLVTSVTRPSPRTRNMSQNVFCGTYLSASGAVCGIGSSRWGIRCGQRAQGGAPHVLEGPRNEPEVRGQAYARLLFCGTEHLVFVLDERDTTYRDRGKITRRATCSYGTSATATLTVATRSQWVVGLSESNSHRSGICSAIGGRGADCCACCIICVAIEHTSKSGQVTRFSSW